jgi:type I restriction enzyme R subunit
MSIFSDLKGTRPQKGHNIAIAEWPTNSTVSKRGYADYALFVGLQLVGIVEAKRAFTDIPSVIDYQCKDYAKEIKEAHASYQIGTWNECKVPFLFATNGRKYLKQLETKSGIWFLDARQSSNIPKALQGWMSPDGMMELLEKDITSANQSLEETPYDLLRDKDGLNLREYQIEAIEAAENAIIEGKQTALLSMATGTGKTRTILGMIYRFVNTGRFLRVLFLVDRTALGEQAQDVFKEAKIEDPMTLNEIYNIQSLVKRILYNEAGTMPSVSDYDLIVLTKRIEDISLIKKWGTTSFFTVIRMIMSASIAQSLNTSMR